MSSLAFLLVALAVSIIGSLWLWLRYRKPSSVEHGIDEFSREMRALSPEARRERDDPSGRSRSGR